VEHAGEIKYRLQGLNGTGNDRYLEMKRIGSEFGEKCGKGH
jgi:hypothetical protein